MADRAGGKSAPKTESTVAGADWSDKDIGDEKHVRVGLSGADLRSATFDHVRMRDADLTGAQCQEASLRDVDLAGALLGRVNFSGCDLRGSDVSAIHPENSDLRGAIVTIEQAVAIAQALGLDVRADSGEDDDADQPIR